MNFRGNVIGLYKTLDLHAEPDLLAGYFPLSPEQLAKDFTSLREMVGRSVPYIAGPDVAEIKQFYHE